MCGLVTAIFACGGSSSETLDAGKDANSRDAIVDDNDDAPIKTAEAGVDAAAADLATADLGSGSVDSKDTPSDEAAPSPGVDAQVGDLDGGPLDAVSESGPVFDADAWKDSGLGTIDAPWALRAGSCDDMIDWSQATADGSVQGTGSCTGKTIDDLVGVIRIENPDLADIVPAVAPVDGGGCLLGPDAGCVCAIETACVPPTDLKVVRHGDGFRFFLTKLSAPSQFIYQLRQYWYFETDDDCHPDKVGAYEEQPGRGFCAGSALWGAPYADRISDCTTALPEMHDCGLDGGRGE
jgi:hypothetical protein